MKTSKYMLRKNDWTYIEDCGGKVYFGLFGDFEVYLTFNRKTYMLENVKIFPNVGESVNMSFESLLFIVDEIKKLEIKENEN